MADIDSDRATDTNTVPDVTLQSEAGNVTHPRVMATNTIIGTRVRNNENETLGKIEDLVVDLQSARVAYAVLSFGGFLGIGNKLFAIPLDLMSFDSALKEFVLNLDRAILEKAPGFDKENWPDFSNRDWEMEVYNYYGSVPRWEEAPRH